MDWTIDEAICVDESAFYDLLTRLPAIRRRLLFGEWLPNECEDCSTTTGVITYRDTTGKEKKPIYLCRTCHEIHPHCKQLKLWVFEQDTASWMRLNKEKEDEVCP